MKLDEIIKQLRGCEFDNLYETCDRIAKKLNADNKYILQIWHEMDDKYNGCNVIMQIINGADIDPEGYYAEWVNTFNPTRDLFFTRPSGDIPDGEHEYWNAYNIEDLDWYNEKVENLGAWDSMPTRPRGYYNKIDPREYGYEVFVDESGNKSWVKKINKIN